MGMPRGVPFFCAYKSFLRVKAAVPLGKRGPLPSCGRPVLQGEAASCWTLDTETLGYKS
jgi:hypothetical protein